MSASNGGLPSESEKTFFTTTQMPFPDILNGKVHTQQFLEASKGVVALVDKFGKVFAPIKYDMSGNIEKLTKTYSDNPERYTYLNDMVLHEKEKGGNVATDALLWLRRALHFVYTFFHCIVEDTEKGRKTEDLVPFLKKAYKDVLERYHGWMAQQLFSLLSRMCPTRKDLLLNIALGLENREDFVIRDMTRFLGGLEINIQALSAFYTAHDLESTARV
ncbi:unnamed protein product [Timema podura]|uniref:Glycolipid transfer protein domain-containing protein n=1 Tax=Timema podura TaxID=61482 RepID=A0ABN7NMS6_TIMPD|nr:unnamed protein product [Timema podura]